MRSSLTITVQAPHWPWSQPFLVPVSFRCSRSMSSSVVRVSSERSCRFPFTSIATAAIGGGLAGLRVCAATGRVTAEVAAVAAPATRTPRLDSSSPLRSVIVFPFGRGRESALTSYDFFDAHDVVPT